MGYEHAAVSQKRVDQARKAIVDAVSHLGRPGFFRIVEEMGFDWGIDYDGRSGKFIVNLSDLQFVALGLAFRAHCEVAPDIRKQGDE